MDELNRSEKQQAIYLNLLFNAALEGDFKEVKRIAKLIRKEAVNARKYVTN